MQGKTQRYIPNHGYVTIKIGSGFKKPQFLKEKPKVKNPNQFLKDLKLYGSGLKILV